MQTLAKFTYSSFNDANDLRGSATDFARGSRNLMPLGLSQYKPFRGLEEVGTGSRLMFPLRDGYGGLEDISPSSLASGSLFSSIAETLFYVGNGQVSVDGTDISGALATSLLRILLKWNGSYTDANSGAYQVGLPEPSALTVGSLDSPPGGTPTTNGTYSFKIARLREVTGGKSRASGTSAVVTLNAQGAYAVVPTASSGQTRWIFFVTTAGLGGVGLHYRIPKANPYTDSEYYESDIQRTVSTLSATNGSAVVTSSASAFTSADEGKLFKTVSSGFSVPTGTTVLSVDSATQITLSNTVTVSSGSNPRSGELISYFNETERCVALNWRESDLAPEAAEISWIYDFPPPSASHAFQLENRIAVATYAGANTDADDENAGTALVFSLSNQLESFDLRYPLYLPEKVVDIIGRGVDSYSFIGCRNGIYAVQYINSDVPATISVLLASEGITSRKNWCVTKRGLYAATGKGKLSRVIANGEEDKLFYEPVRSYIRDWEQEDIVVVPDLKNNGIIFTYLNESLYYDEQTNRWSTPLYLNDTADGEMLSAVGARSKTFVTMDDGTDRKVYVFDSDNMTGSNIVGMSPYVGNEAHFILQRISAEIVADDANGLIYLGVHKNNLPTFTEGSMTSGSNTLSGTFTAEHLGCYVLVVGAGASGAPLFGRIKQFVSSSSVRIGTPTESLADSVNLNASASAANAYVLIASNMFKITPNRTGTIQARSPELFLNGTHSFAVSVFAETAGTSAQPLQVEIDGTQTQERWNIPSAVWGA